MLFYVFYYKQGTYQQYPAGAGLRTRAGGSTSSNLYQTWFQRHEDPKTIDGGV